MAALIKVRRLGDPGFLFLSSGGRTNRLRVHAVRFEDKEGKTGEERAGETAYKLAADNPGFEFLAVKE